MFVLILAPPAIQPAAALAELDSQRDERRLRQEARRLNPRERALPDWLDALGYRAAALLRRTGIDLGALNSDLSVLGRSLDCLLGAVDDVGEHGAADEVGDVEDLDLFLHELLPYRLL